MKYYKETVSSSRLAWWNGLPEREQALRICLFRLQKWDIPEHKTLLAYNNSARAQLKENIRMFKLMAKALKRQLPVKSQAHFIKPCPTYRVIEWCCGHCQQEIPMDVNYCPNCGQRTDD